MLFVVDVFLHFGSGSPRNIFVGQLSLPAALVGRIVGKQILAGIPLGGCGRGFGKP